MINLLLQTGFPFASFRFPREHELINIVQTEKRLLTYDPAKIENTSGFLFAPFDKDGNTPHVLIREDISFTCNIVSGKTIPFHQSLRQVHSSLSRFPEITKEDYLKRIDQVLHRIEEGKVKKVVLSRSLLISLPLHFDFAAFFTALLNRYPGAFIFLVSLPGKGIWAGASPELFLILNNWYLETTSLAGTLHINKKDDALQWTEKEKQEQQIVSEYIKETFESLGLNKTKINISGPGTILAGHLAHLQTTFRIPAAEIRGQLPELITALHPTPSICGYPKREALDIIRQTEQYDREYYTGYLGPWNTSYPSRLYINLRSMQSLPGTDRVVLYAGGGITSDSNPCKEWEETEMKISTLLSVLEKMTNFV